MDCNEIPQERKEIPQDSSTSDHSQNWPYKQKLAIPFAAEYWRVDHVGLGASQGQQCLTNFFDRGLLHRRIAHDAALPYLLASGFELRLYQNDDLPAVDAPLVGGKAAAITAGRTRVAEMNDTSITTRSTRFADLFRRQIAGVGFFQQADASVLAETEIDLAVAGIDRDDARSAALQKTIGKSSG